MMEFGPSTEALRSGVVLHYDWEESPGYWISMTLQALRRSLNTELSAQGITLRQWEVLACIALGGELSQAELAERLGIEAPTLVGILDRMERDGWLDRYNCQQDRRRKRIRATEKAESFWTRMADCAHEVRSRAIRGVTVEELATLKSVCARIRGNLESSSEPEIAAEAATCELPTVSSDECNVPAAPACDSPLETV